MTGNSVPERVKETEARVAPQPDLGALDPLGLLDSLAKVALKTATTTAPAHCTQLAREWVKVAAGNSSIEAGPRDWRFANRAWREHPVYRRAMQAYLAWSDAVSGLVEDADVDWQTRERARFAAGIVTSAASPTNHPLCNPEALERAFETAGRSVLKGVGNFTRDLSRNGGLPRSVESSAFEVGRDLAATPGAVIFANEALELLQYAPSTEAVHERPVVVVPPQINKYYVMDLAPGRSFVEFARDRGFQVFAVSWRNPTAAQSAWGLSTYVEALESALQVAAEIAGSDTVSTVAVCAGGITTAALLGYLAASVEELVHSTTFAVTHLDYEVPATVGMFATQRIVEKAVAGSGRAGVLTGRNLGALFALLRPNDLVWNYWVHNNLLGEEPPRFDVLAWNSDATSLPAALHADFLDIYLKNSMARGELAVRGSRIELAKVKADAMVVAARNDHLVPWKASYATTRLLGGTSEFVLSSSGHIQSLVNPPGTAKMTITTGPPPTPDPDEWLTDAQEVPGVWWQRWSDWQAPRAGMQRRAPAGLGNRRHPPGVAAPGRYVRNC